MEVSGIVGLIILALNIFAILKIVQSGADTVMKVVWILAVLVFPVIGVIVWYFFGPGGAKG